MQERHIARPKSIPSGLRALDACGEGFWEFDLLDGSAWFNEWFYRKLHWAREAKRATLSDLEAAVRPAAWLRLMSTFRDTLERGAPLDLEIEVELTDQRLERWRMRGSAARNDAGKPVYLAGSMRDVTDEPDRSQVGAMGCLRGAFDALPVAAALLDRHAALLAANQLWSAFPAALSAQAIARLKAANSQTAVEFWLDQGGVESGIGARQLRVRAIAFQHDGHRHLAVTLEDRRSD